MSETVSNPPRLRATRESDWPEILEVANASVVEEPAAGAQDEWLANRRRFDPATGRQRHFVAASPATDEVLGYGAVESRDEQGSDTFRLFIVTRDERLETIGAALYERALECLKELHARRVVFLEYSRCRTLGAFAEARGFVERDRFHLPNDGPEVVLRSLRLG